MNEHCLTRAAASVPQMADRQFDAYRGVLEAHGYTCYEENGVLYAKAPNAEDGEE